MESLVSSLAGEAVKDGLFELLNEEMSRISELWLQSKKSKVTLEMRNTVKQEAAFHLN